MWRPLLDELATHSWFRKTGFGSLKASFINRYGAVMIRTRCVFASLREGSNKDECGPAVMFAAAGGQHTPRNPLCSNPWLEK